MILLDYDNRFIDACISLMFQLLMILITYLLFCSLIYNKAIHLQRY